MKLNDRKAFLNAVEKEFPEISLGDQYSEGLLHCEVADFREHLEEQIERDQLWCAEKGFRLIEELLKKANPELKNAIEISFLEDFAIGDQTEKQVAFVKERVSGKVREILKKHSPEWP